MLDAAKLADICVVPLCYQSTADLMPAVKTVLTLIKVNPSIALLINNTDPANIPDLKAVLSERFPTLPLFVVNRSKYIARLADDGQTAFDLFALGGLHKFALRHLLPQLKAFYAYLSRPVSLYSRQEFCAIRSAGCAA